MGGAWWWLAVVVGASGCVATSERTCDDGAVCPERLTCRPEGGGCVEPALIDACAEQAVGAPCDLLDGTPGRCRAQVCTLARCGDGVVDAVDGEVCDDGNAADGDGCARDCTSDETCGNGVRDATEACDDGNLDDGDACTTTCALPSCGDGAVQAGEACDAGAANDDAGACTTRCAEARCGDFLVQLGIEACDLGTNNDDTGSCTSGCALAACPDGLVWAGVESCDDGNAIDGDGCQATCRLPACGDGIVDPGEVCDDANLAAGDGCTPDCASDESCGNGLLDFFAGETCDDGATYRQDGCSAICQVEPRRWRQAQPALTPPARFDNAYAYDPYRARLVMYGGNPGRSDTWEWDGRTWREVVTTRSPGTRASTGMAFDLARARVVLFGGAGAAGAGDDTWEYDGVDWVQRLPATSPPPRSTHGMSYDAARHVTVVFGGGAEQAGPFVPLGDTWEYDGTTWTERTPATAPSARGHVSMVYDVARRRTVLQGGFGANGDTWQWDGTTWTSQPSTLGTVNFPELAYDVRRQRVVLYSGGAINEWDGATWTAVPSAVVPVARNQLAIAYDTARGEVVLFGGRDAGGSTEGRTWVWNGTIWAERTALAAPPRRTNHVMAFDSRRGVVVAFGGYDETFQLRDTTLEWDGATWSERVMATAVPVPRFDAAMGFDEVRGVMVLFGGADEFGQAYGDTWEYDGTSWTERADVLGPGPRSDTGLVWDAARRELVMFGGDSASADTWTYDGAWTQHSPATSPAASSGQRLAWDARHEQVVMYGAEARATWIWDGTTWTRYADDGQYPAKDFHVLAADLGGVVTFGGAAGVTSNETWSWDVARARWQRVLTDVAPVARRSPGMAFDSWRQELVMYGGFAPPGGLLRDTWIMALASTTPAETCIAGVDYDGDGDAGCADAECWGRCAPQCPIVVEPATCDGTPSCGDGTCAAPESCRVCPDDCGACAADVCGDAFCDAGETLANCPVDCPA